MKEWKKRFWTIALGYLILMVAMFAITVYGDDTEEPVGMCARGYERFCEPTWKQDIEDRAALWNEFCDAWNDTSRPFGPNDMCF